MPRIMLAAASFAALACLGACGNDSDAASDEAVVVTSTPTPEPTPVDPFAWNDVPYQEYLDAAEELGLRPDVLLPEAGFSSGLSTLCRTTAEDMVAMRSSHQSYTEDAATYSTAKYLADEVGLRIGLACPQRMTDWTAAGYDERDQHEGDEDDDGVSAVTDEDLARAAAEEAAASSAPGHHHGTSDDHSDAEDESAPADHESGVEYATASTDESTDHGGDNN